MTSSADRVNLNNLSYWFPLVQKYGLPVPDTALIETESDLTALLDGHEPDGWNAFVEQVRSAVVAMGYPCFLRTGYGSGKHDWRNTCFVRIPEEVDVHIFNLVEWSNLVDIMGLPTQTWAVRKLLDTVPLFTCKRYGGMPVVREFRLFVDDGGVQHMQPYWPSDAVRRGGPSVEQWKTLLIGSWQTHHAEREHLHGLALDAHDAVGGGFWSVDLLQDRSGDWWLTDMARGEDSFWWDPDREAPPA
jgi:hypothetical protein